MNIETERKYHDIIEKTIIQMAAKVPLETLQLIKTSWRKSLSQTFNQRRKTRKKLQVIKDPDSEDDYLIPECPSTLTGKLIRFRKEKPYWKAKLRGCILRFENQNEKILPKVTINVISDFFKD